MKLEVIIGRFGFQLFAVGCTELRGVLIYFFALHSKGLGLDIRP